jgi:hypothetical protein
MSKPLTVSIPHELGKAEARRRIESGFGSIEEQLSSGAIKMTFTERWENDRLHFTGRTLGQTVKGHLDVMEDSVRVEVVLPRLLAALGETLKGRLQKQGTRLLEKK